MEQYPETHETAQEAYERQYQELSKVATRVFNKIKGYHDSKRAKTWDEVGDLEYIVETMNDLDEFLGV